MIIGIAEAIRRQVTEQTDLTLVELRDWAQTILSVRVHLSSLDRFLRSLGYRYKKTLRASEQDRPDVAQARADLATDLRSSTPGLFG